MKSKYLFTCGLIMSMIVSTPSLAEDSCSLLKGKALSITANGYKGNVATYIPGLELSLLPDGTYTFESAIRFDNEKPDKLTGTCKDRHITLKRTREGGFVQDFDGWLFEKGGKYRGMAGTFSHNGVTKWSWCGQMTMTNPK